MVSLLSKKHLKSRHKHLDFEWSGFWMVGTIAVAIAWARPTIWKPDHLKSALLKVRISNVYGFQMVRFQILIVIDEFALFKLLDQQFRYHPTLGFFWPLSTLAHLCLMYLCHKNFEMFSQACFCGLMTSSNVFLVIVSQVAPDHRSWISGFNSQHGHLYRHCLTGNYCPWCVLTGLGPSTETTFSRLSKNCGLD